MLDTPDYFVKFENNIAPLHRDNCPLPEEPSTDLQSDDEELLQHPFTESSDEVCYDEQLQVGVGTMAPSDTGIDEESSAISLPQQPECEPIHRDTVRQYCPSYVERQHDFQKAVHSILASTSNKAIINAP
eukprot:5276453-Ditylum_brightwellii.AAC.1